MENLWRGFRPDGRRHGRCSYRAGFRRGRHESGEKENLPFIQHVGMDGKFKPEVKDFAGLFVKPKENSQATDIEIIKWLAKENKLLKQRKTYSFLSALLALRYAAFKIRGKLPVREYQCRSAQAISDLLTRGFRHIKAARFGHG